MKPTQYRQNPDGKMNGSVSLGGKTPPASEPLPVKDDASQPAPSSPPVEQLYATLVSRQQGKGGVVDTPVKYPRTSHLPSSPGLTADDRVISADGLRQLQAAGEFIVTEKMDGGNVTMMRDHFYARSLDSGTHPWDTRAKALWGNVRFSIPEGYRLSGESLQAQRSVAYDNLAGFYLIFGVWDETNTLLDWDTTELIASELSIPTVPVLYRGDNYTAAVSAWSKARDRQTSEGFVVRSAASIPADDFPNLVAKYVRANHVTTSADWRHRDDYALNTLA